MKVSEIAEKLTTSQQMSALSVYSHYKPTLDFQQWYSLWCSDNGLHNDIYESNLEAQERPDWAQGDI